MRRLRARRFWIVSAAVYLMAILFLVPVWPQVSHQLELSFVQQPAAFTELYFEGDRTTSLKGPDGRPQVGVDFAIADRSDTAQAYVYQVLVSGRDRRPVAGETDRVDVPADSTHHVVLRLDLPSTEIWYSVDVRLVGRTERIHDAAPIGS